MPTLQIEYSFLFQFLKGQIEKGIDIISSLKS